MLDKNQVRFVFVGPSRTGKSVACKIVTGKYDLEKEKLDPNRLGAEAMSDSVGGELIMPLLRAIYTIGKAHPKYYVSSTS